MFQNCTSLTTAPELPAMKLARYCYQGMFKGCTSLTTASELPATTLVKGCYKSMYHSCSSLTVAPVLHVAKLVDSCYATMFVKCSSLNKIICLATDKSAYECTDSWVQMVASSGTFYKDASMNNWKEGASGYWYGWTLVDYTG